MWNSLSLHQMGTTSGPWSNHYHADISMMVEDEVGKREENDQRNLSSTVWSKSVVS